MGKYTQLNHKNKALGLAREVIWWVEHGKVTHGRFLEIRNDILFESNSWNRLTTYNQQYIMGYMDHWLDQLELSALDWRVYHPELGHVKKEDYHVLEGRWSELDSDMGATFWRGTNKVWYPNEVAEMYE